MKKLYFTRHGQTFWNVENKICGATDIGLTELGHRQAIACGQAILDAHLPIDLILYSPLIRAKDTAMHISEITGIKAMEERRLKEQNFGKFESTPRDGHDFYLAKRTFCYDFDGGESMMQMAHRIYGLLAELKESDKTYLLVAHNGIARIVASYFHNMTNDEFASAGIKNCEVVTYTFKDV
ncbi:histidine phosphatase family protein [Sharpea azabuensis]|uniref:histidine phosphatase family protein n=1 Tax=Sharpea azabuensis TaxID=322505 RepID=UPI00156C0ECB|nr:histidine phosphatase family protein [Sharpea azabuensis]